MSISRFARFAMLPVAVASAPAWAGQVEVDATMCFGGTSHVISAAEGVTLGTYQLTGPIVSAQPGGALDGSGAECIGTFEIVGRAYSHLGYCLSVDRDGHRAWGRDIWNASEDSYEYLGGTGKYAGISGKLVKTRRAPVARARPGTLQGCAQLKGTYSTP